MQNARLDETQAGIKISRRNINSFRYSGDTTLMAQREVELKSLFMKLREEREREEKKKQNGLKTQHSKNEDHGIWSRHFTLSRWGNNGNSERLSFLGLQNHCRW